PAATPGAGKSRPPGLPSPALCCACGLCVMLAGINLTLVGAFAFGTFLPGHNPPIVIGPVLLLLAISFFGACCVCSRRPTGAGPAGRGGKGPSGSGLGLGLGRAGLAGFELETSEHTVQDTTAIQLSPANSPSSSRRSTPVQAGPGACGLFTMEGLGPLAANGPAGEGAHLNLPREPVGS
ncbi:transmembrane protein 275, partial [Ornithorhynchus anatinus]|uniref:transmembrane protein 275 n=1 Tax=Ornithorhynchus anatinus TaxID=9258 RepID=UPI0010A9253E